MKNKYHKNRFDKLKKTKLDKIDPKLVNIEEIEKALKEFDMDLPIMKNTKWTDEEGNNYSSWEISGGKHKLRTGDGGAELFLKALKKEAQKWTNPIENEKEK